MLGSPGVHSEEEALLQALFVKAAPLVALRMLAPQLLLLDRGSGQFNTMTPASIALWSGECLAQTVRNSLPEDDLLQDVMA